MPKQNCTPAGVLPSGQNTPFRLQHNNRAAEMYRLYCGGLSLSGVANVYGLTRQSVYDSLTRRGYKLRTMDKQPTVSFGGNLYTERSDGYWRKTTGDRRQLHSDVWEVQFGAIPDGYELHHRDSNKSNNAIDNLECLTAAEHTRKYNPHNNQFTAGAPNRPHEDRFPKKLCICCGSEIIPHTASRKENPSAFALRVYCGMQCSRKDRIGKSRTYRPIRERVA